MQRLNEIVELYLQMETNYALMITGEWGVGKTNYFENTLRDKISITPVFENNSKKYRPILVSLFGLKSVEEIQSEIFLCLFPFLKDNKFKLSASIGKAIAKGIMHLKGLGEFNKYIEGINVNKNTLINFEELVLCFDDLERISKSLNMEEFIGYVNSLVERENVKVLIIANEGQINDKSYSALKEKVIGNSIEFIPSLTEIYDNIVTDKFTSFKQYKKFLEKNKETILDAFSKRSNNFRILIFALKYFQMVFSEISIQLPKEKALKEKQTEILSMLLKFSLCIAIEYRKEMFRFPINENSIGIGEHR